MKLRLDAGLTRYGKLWLLVMTRGHLVQLEAALLAALRSDDLTPDEAEFADLVYKKIQTRLG